MGTHLDNLKNFHIVSTPEIYIQSAPNNLFEPCTFFVWADWAVLGSTETAQQKVKYATFNGCFFNYSWAKYFF